MPIIDFPYYLDSLSLRASVSGRVTIRGYETVDGLGVGDLGADVFGVSAIYPNITIDGETFIGAEISSTTAVSALASVSTLLGSVDISTISYIFAKASYSDGIGYLNPLVSLGSDREIAQGIGYLPTLYSAGDGDFYVPPIGYRHYALLTGLSSAGLVKNPELGVGFLPTLVGQAWDSTFTDEDMGGATTLKALVGSAAEGLRLEVLMHSYLFGFSGFIQESDIVLVFSSDMSVASIFTASRYLVQNYLETFSVNSDFTYLGAYQLTKIEALGLTSTFLAVIGAAPGTFTENTTTWVFNLDGGGTTQYDNYGFNSFARRGTEYLGAASDGIYTLTGSTDAGSNISAEISLATSKFDTAQNKYFPAVYLGATSTGKLLLKVNVDGTDWLYEANNTSTVMANQRVDIGRGLHGSHWHFTILNQNGVDFDLESVEFLPLVSSRRIY